MRATSCYTQKSLRFRKQGRAMWLQILSISVGATAGALLRWVLSTRAIPSLPLPLGTLSANLLGAYLIGMALAVFAARSEERRVGKEWSYLSWSRGDYT